jgi:hypothetical protein
VLSASANRYIRAVCAISVRDCTSGFRCWRREALAGIPLDRIGSEGYAFLVELLYEAVRRRCAITEVPISFIERRHGASKLSGRVMFESALLPWRIAFDSTRTQSPADFHPDRSDTVLSDADSHASAVRAWRLADAVALVIGVVCVYGMRRVDPDLYGYLTYGRLFLERGTLTGNDPFAYTSADSPLGDVRIHCANHLMAGLPLVGPARPHRPQVPARRVAIAALYAAIRFAGRDPMVVSSHVRALHDRRRSLLSVPPAALHVRVLQRVRPGAVSIPAPRPGASLAPASLMLMWANSHGGFVAGLGAIGLAIILRVCDLVSRGSWSVGSVVTGTRPLWLTLAACFVATLFNRRACTSGATC